MANNYEMRDSADATTPNVTSSESFKTPALQVGAEAMANLRGSANSKLDLPGLQIEDSSNKGGKFVPITGDAEPGHGKDDQKQWAPITGDKPTRPPEKSGDDGWMHMMSSSANEVTHDFTKGEDGKYFHADPVGQPGKSELSPVYQSPQDGKTYIIGKPDPKDLSPVYTSPDGGKYIIGRPGEDELPKFR